MYWCLKYYLSDSCVCSTIYCSSKCLNKIIQWAEQILRGALYIIFLNWELIYTCDFTCIKILTNWSEILQSYKKKKGLRLSLFPWVNSRRASVVNTNEFCAHFHIFSCYCWEVAQIKTICLLIYILFINHAIKPLTAKQYMSPQKLLLHQKAFWLLTRWVGRMCARKIHEFVFLN